MLVDRYDPEDVFARVPEVAQQTDPVLKTLDQLLEDDQLYRQVRADLGKRYRLTLVPGRHSTPVEVILRILLCKHLYGWSYEETTERVADSLVLRWFCRVYFQTVPDKSTLIRLPPHAAPRDPARPQRSGGRTGKTSQGDQRTQAAAGCDVRADHHPSSHDSGLLLDSVRVLSRLVKRAKPLVQEHLQNVGAACRSRLRRARRAAQALHRLLRRKSETKEQDQQALYQQSERVAKRLREQAEQVVPLVKRVIAQTRSRVLEGKKVVSADKVLSLFEPHTRAIPATRGAPRSSLGGT